mgnify:CR=1 FL=1
MKQSLDEDPLDVDSPGDSDALVGKPKVLVLVLDHETPLAKPLESHRNAAAGDPEMSGHVRHSCIPELIEQELDGRQMMSSGMAHQILIKLSPAGHFGSLASLATQTG